MIRRPTCKDFGELAYYSASCIMYLEVGMRCGKSNATFSLDWPTGRSRNLPQEIARLALIVLWSANLRTLFCGIAKSRCAHQYGQGNRRGYQAKPDDQDFVQHGPALKYRKANDRSSCNEYGAQRRPERRRVDPLVECAEPQEAQRTDQCDDGASKNEKCRESSSPGRQVFDAVHSITSPRSRNFASATVPTKPKRAMARAASK